MYIGIGEGKGLSDCGAGAGVGADADALRKFCLFRRLAPAQRKKHMSFKYIR